MSIFNRKNLNSGIGSVSRQNSRYAKYGLGLSASNPSSLIASLERRLPSVNTPALDSRLSDAIDDRFRIDFEVASQSALASLTSPHAVGAKDVIVTGDRTAKVCSAKSTNVIAGRNERAFDSVKRLLDVASSRRLSRMQHVPTFAGRRHHAAIACSW